MLFFYMNRAIFEQRKIRKRRSRFRIKRLVTQVKYLPLQQLKVLNLNYFQLVS